MVEDELFFEPRKTTIAIIFIVDCGFQRGIKVLINDFCSIEV
jgi:hypothetical protein